MHGGENLHWVVARIDTLEFLVDLENSRQLSIQFAAWNMRQIQIDTHAFFFNAEPIVDADIENLSCRNIARHQVSVFGISILEEIIALIFRNRAGLARILRFAWH